MTTSLMRLRTLTAAAVIFLFALGSGSTAQGAAPTPPGEITFVGTDSNIYYCDAKCHEPKCITCKAAAMHVRRDDTRDDAIVKVDAVPEAGAGPRATEDGFPPCLPGGKRVACSA